MRFLFAPDSFKGTMTSEHVIDLLKSVAKRKFPSCEIMGLPVGDGGEGTVDACISAKGGHFEKLNVCGPMGESTLAEYGVLDDRTVLIEMAKASGLTLVKENNRDPLLASSYGTGEILNTVLNKGYRNIILMIGGSATNDGGTGMASALGIEYKDEKGHVLDGNGFSLSQIKSIDDSNINKNLKDANITVMCDVNNTLLGPDGATYVYGPQKGADENMLIQLEEGMKNYIDVFERHCNLEIRDIKGTGAAGGLVVPLLAYSKTKILPGIKAFLELTNFDEMLEGVDVVITGEGRLDSQSSQGKVISGIGESCKKKNIPVDVIAGTIGKGFEKIYDFGIRHIEACDSYIENNEDVMIEHDKYFCLAAERLFETIEKEMMEGSYGKRY